MKIHLKKDTNLQIISRLMFKLLPIQILLAVVNAVDNLISSYFASNFVGIDAMSAAGVYGPANMLIGAISMVLTAGAAIICGKYLGQNQREKLQEVFSLTIALSLLIGGAFTVLFLVMSGLDLTGFFTSDAALRPKFNSYLAGHAYGIIPMILGAQLPAFLTMENRSGRTLTASIVYVIGNIVFSALFILVIPMKEFGISFSSAVAQWFFLLIQIQYFFTKKSFLKVDLKKAAWKQSGEILKIGFPGAASNLYQTARGIIVNKLLEANIGTIALSAFAGANDLMNIFWTIPTGMICVSRLLISVSVGEEDRQTLTDIMKVMFTRYVPLMCAVSFLIICFSGPLTMIFYPDKASQVYQMTSTGLRILPLCMPFSVVVMHFVGYGQAMNKNLFVNIESLLDGVVCVALFSFLLIRPLGITAVYIANVLNGVVTVAFIVFYSWHVRKKMPKTMDELMVIPDDFGAGEDERLDLSIRSLEEVVSVSQRVQSFCLEKGIDKKRAYLASLSMEEMAGNIVEHGFTKDTKDHSVDIRVVHKGDKVILRIKDDCVPFDPKERSQIVDNEDPTKNIGIRMIYKIMKDITYQNILGLNVLTIMV